MAVCDGDSLMSKLRLPIELVPQPLWGKTLSKVSRKSTKCNALWQSIRAKELARTKRLCEVCGEDGRVVHEKWGYDDTSRVQKLTGFEVVCWNCSNAHHLGAASVQGYADEAIRHFMKVNALSQQRAQQLLHEAARVMIERSK